jgi:2-keto-4-pentenoate hydratase/2-oxohepta-3-ene-1,7-dioic acid hydratase in catechol pathway
VTDDGRSIARYLKNGDVVRIKIGGIGVLENEIVERSA